MQEWSLQTGSRKSTNSQENFLDGQMVRSVLCVAEKEGLLRLDFHPEEEFDLDGARPVAQWIRTFRSNDSEKELAREAVESADELFDQLMSDSDPAEEEGGQNGEIRGILRYLLALHLERKRILRPKGRIQPDGIQIYRHPKRDRDYRVESVELRMDLIREIEEQLDFVLT